MGGLLVAGYVVGGVVRGIGIVVVCHYRLILLYHAIAANCIKFTLTWF